MTPERWQQIKDALETVLAQPAAAWAGRRIGPYRIEREIGHGGCHQRAAAVPLG